MINKQRLLDQFEEALRSIDPHARVLVLEVRPSLNFVTGEEGPVHLEDFQITLINELIGPDYKVVPSCFVPEALAGDTEEDHE